MLSVIKGKLFGWFSSKPEVMVEHKPPVLEPAVESTVAKKKVTRLNTETNWPFPTTRPEETAKPVKAQTKKKKVATEAPVKAKAAPAVKKAVKKAAATPAKAKAKKPAVKKKK